MRSAGRRLAPAPRKSFEHRENGMVRYVIRRLLWAVVLFIAVTVVTYLIFFLIPVDPARLAAGKSATPAEVKAVAHRLYLDRPVYEQYLHFLGQLVLHGSLGYSFNDRQSVNSSIFAAAPVTASLVHRRRRGVDADRGAGRDPLGAQAAVARRPHRHGRRPRRHLGAPGVDRPHGLLHLRLQAEPAPDPGLLQPARGVAPARSAAGPSTGSRTCSCRGSCSPCSTRRSTCA